MNSYPIHGHCLQVELKFFASRNQPFYRTSLRGTKPGPMKMLLAFIRNHWPEVQFSSHTAHSGISKNCSKSLVWIKFRCKMDLIRNTMRCKLHNNNNNLSFQWRLSIITREINEVSSKFSNSFLSDASIVIKSKELNTKFLSFIQGHTCWPDLV